MTTFEKELMAALQEILEAGTEDAGNDSAGRPLPWEKYLLYHSDISRYRGLLNGNRGTSVALAEHWKTKYLDACRALANRNDELLSALIARADGAKDSSYLEIRVDELKTIFSEQTRKDYDAKD